MPVGSSQGGPVDNRQIIDALLELADGLEILDDNPFKVRAYRKAAQSIEALAMPVSDLVERGEISRVDGVGKAIADKIEAWVKRGDFSALEEVRSRIPQGIDELLKVPGLGIKRVRMLHEQLGINTLEDLLGAGRRGLLAGIKGFPQKRVLKLEEAVEKVIGYRGKYLIDLSLEYAGEVLGRLREAGLHAELSGECRRKMEVITTIDVLVEKTPQAKRVIREWLPDVPVNDERGIIQAQPNRKRPPVWLHMVEKRDFPLAMFFTTGSKEHVERMQQRARKMQYTLNDTGMFSKDERIEIQDEKDIYRVLGLPYIPPEIREEDAAAYYEQDYHIPRLLEDDHLKGTVHNHTTFSDGKTPLKELVLKACEMGYDWIGISDHSRSAHYAGGMSIDDIKRQHGEIEELSRSIDGITILKGIESDILPDGSLDYPDEVLSAFDFVIASIHSHMDMTGEKMTDRIVQALKNPFTAIFAHPTGRLLLSREPYKLDLDVVLAEAVKNRVAIELNANPMRLDIDWRLIPGFIRAGGKIAIGPDAHVAGGLLDMRYGVMMARKGLLTPDACLNTCDATEIRRVLQRP
jgi:DNA polymerase (family 10)